MKLISKKRLQEIRRKADIKTEKEIREYGVDWCYEMAGRYPSSTPVWPIIAGVPAIVSLFCWMLISITQIDEILFLLIPLLFIVVGAVWFLLSQSLCSGNSEGSISGYECLLWVATSAYIPISQSQINSATYILHEYVQTIQLSSINFEALSFALAIYFAVSYRFVRYTFIAIASVIAIGVSVNALNFYAIPYFSEILYMIISTSMPVLLSHRVSGIRIKSINEQRIRFKNVRAEHIAKDYTAFKRGVNGESVVKNVYDDRNCIIHKNRKRKNPSRSSRKNKKR